MQPEQNCSVGNTILSLVARSLAQNRLRKGNTSESPYRTPPKSKTDAHYQKQPLQPRSFAVDGRARGKDSEEEVEESGSRSCQDGSVGEQEDPKIVRRDGKWLGTSGR